MPDKNEMPQRPADSECCEAGCTPCVWDTYFEQMAEWQAAEVKRKEAEKVESQDG